MLRSSVRRVLCPAVGIGATADSSTDGQSTTSAMMWFFKTDKGRFKRMLPQAEAELEQAVANGAGSLKSDLATGSNYTVDLTSMTQTNDRTRVQRELRRSIAQPWVAQPVALTAQPTTTATTQQAAAATHGAAALPNPARATVVSRKARKLLPTKRPSLFPAATTADDAVFLLRVLQAVVEQGNPTAQKPDDATVAKAANAIITYAKGNEQVAAASCGPLCKRVLLELRELQPSTT